MGVARAVSVPFSLDYAHRKVRPFLNLYKHLVPKKTPKPRGGRLARRARSFKEDFFGKISQMRTPTGQRSSSPNKNNKVKSKSPVTTDEVDGKDLNQADKDVDCVLHHVNQLTKCLQYFEDVVRKDKLEMLPGSATVVLETVLGIHSSLRKCVPTVNEQSTMLMSATNQVYQSLANLIRWSDEILLYNSAGPNKEGVKEVINAVHDSVKNLVQLCMDRVQNKESKPLPSPAVQNGLCSPKPDRNSLPDIPLTPREREILQQTVFPVPEPPPHQNHLHHSTSSDSILSSASKKHISLPPPKPPLPLTADTTTPLSSSHLRNGSSVPPPPLPPKKRQALVTLTSNTSQTNGTITATTVKHTSAAEDFLNSLNWLTPLKYNGDSSNLWNQSFTTSLDSSLNHSADDLLLFNKSDNQVRQLESRHCQQMLNASRQQTMCSYAVFSSKKTTKTVVQSMGTGSSMDNILSHVTRASAEKLSSDLNLASSSPSPPPALPLKQRVTRNRTPSQYDNVPMALVPDSERHSELSSGRGSLEEDHFHLTHSQSMIHYPTCLSQAMTSLCPHHGSHLGKGSPSEDGRPPPLPPKQKNVMAYMQMFGSYSQPAEGDFSRHSLHSYQVVEAQWQQVELSFMQQRSFTSSVVSSSEDSAFSESRSSHGSWDQSFGEDEHNSLISTPPALPPKKNRISMSGKPLDFQIPSLTQDGSVLNTEELPAIAAIPANRDGDHWIKEGSDLTEQGPIDEIDASHYLVFKKPEDDGGEDVRGGPVDALIVHATKAPKNDFYYQEAFLTTYRTFISPLELMQKLLYRYNRFIHVSDMRQRAARNAFALLVRVVDDLCLGDVEEELLRVLMDFICQLVSSGDLVLARALRKKVIEKCEAKQRLLMPQQILLPSMAISTHHASLLDFKSEHLAEQMTSLDAALFQKIEIPEVLLWAKEQKEEMSPNLTTFTEHFNKMSYWARSRILDQEDAKDRERYVMKFIKMMKHLRKLNNFNSYLAILSALDSAPIRRLEWQRNITEGLKEYCALIDSSSSFRAYRQALGETEPPCIPYIGLILQDLTFVHIGNPDTLTTGDVNFSKRWQQFNILENMKRFHNCHYPFKRDASIIEFFNNFDEYLCEEAMWQISESIKPRGGKKKPGQL